MSGKVVSSESDESGEEPVGDVSVARNASRGESRKKWLSESYALQSKEIWPGRGQHVLAQFDEESVVVYQAYKPEIADYAAEHKEFRGCKLFGDARMTWIKTNFLWMMFRSRWAGKPNQNRVLAIWLKREAFEGYLENARRKGSVRGFKGTVRLQWDPDHFPNGERHPYRRAVQLGLKGVTSFIDGTDILDIQDVTAFVREHAKNALAKKPDEDVLQVARERVYYPDSPEAREALQLDEPPQDS